MAPRITSARERSKRSASKRPTSSTNRPARSRASTNSNRITSDRLRNELKGVKRRSTNTTSSRNRAARAKKSTASTTQGRGVNRTAGSVRGTQGPARAPIQGPRTPSVQGPSRPTSSGLIGSRAPVQAYQNPPRVQGAPRIGGGTGTQAQSQVSKNAVTAFSRGLQIGKALQAGNPLSATGLMIANDIMNRGWADGTLEGKPVAEMQGPPVPAPRSQSKPVIQAPKPKAKKNKAVLAKKGGKTGSLVNSLFIAHPWSSKQRMRYEARR